MRATTPQPAAIRTETPDAKALIRAFLAAVSTATHATSAAWQATYIDGVRDVAPEGSEAHRLLVDIQPLDDLYFAGAVGLEAAKIRRYCEPTLAGDLLMELAAQVDRAAERPDRYVSDMVFAIVSRLDVESGADVLTMPYDKVVHILLQHIGLDRTDAARPLMHDFAFRHALGEPLARHMPDWWRRQAPKLRHTAPAASRFEMAAE